MAIRSISHVGRCGILAPPGDAWTGEAHLSDRAGLGEEARSAGALKGRKPWTIHPVRAPKDAIGVAVERPLGKPPRGPRTPGLLAGLPGPS